MASGAVTRLKWNAAQTDATLVTGGKSKLIGTQTWVYPNEIQCLQCRAQVARDSLGLETPQQNSSITYPQTGQSANQLATLYSIGVPSPPVAADPATLPRYDDPDGSTGGTLSQRARSCLHTNCAQCNRTGGPTPVNIDFRYTTSLAASNACDVVPQDTPGIPDARIVAPGNADASVIVARMNRRDQDAMPPLGSTVIDTDGVALVTQWINRLANCSSPGGSAFRASAESRSRSGPDWISASGTMITRWIPAPISSTRKLNRHSAMLPARLITRRDVIRPYPSAYGIASATAVPSLQDCHPIASEEPTVQDAVGE